MVPKSFQIMDMFLTFANVKIVVKVVKKSQNV